MGKGGSDIALILYGSSCCTLQHMPACALGGMPLISREGIVHISLLLKPGPPCWSSHEDFSAVTRLEANVVMAVCAGMHILSAP